MRKPTFRRQFRAHAPVSEGELRVNELGLRAAPEGARPRRVTTARDDKILASRFWRRSFGERRCIVAASPFCEPNGDVKPATWHWFGLRGQDERPLFAFPGIWRRHHGPVK